MSTTSDYYRVYYGRYKDRYKERYNNAKTTKLFREDGELIDGCYYINYYKDWIYRETHGKQIPAETREVSGESQRKIA